jgi:hypothetical protein
MMSSALSGKAAGGNLFQFSRSLLTAWAQALLPDCR